MLLHWPLFWISSAMHSMASLLDSQARKRVEAIRDEYWDTFPVGELQRLRGLADIRPSDVTGAQRKEAFEAGAASAKAVLAESSNPLLMSNELCDDELSTAHAMGWNSVWAAEENSRRVAEHRANS